MIKLEHTVSANAEQMTFIIEGMRNPMNSWSKSDSDWYAVSDEEDKHDIIEHDNENDLDYLLGHNDYELMRKLSSSGADHRKFMRMIPVYVRITAPLYWWKEFDTYKVGTVSNSCSTMHKITSKEFSEHDFSDDHLGVRYDGSEENFTIKNNDEIMCNADCTDILRLLISILNFYRKKYIETKDKAYWWKIIQLLPSSYNQTRNVMMNYEVLANIYKSRKNHKLDEWVAFCKWIEGLPYNELITG
nr:MAG TPA: hypothetical protein [Caudoviricetes sp.]